MDIDDIRIAILEDLRLLGRRITVEEALIRYAAYGSEGREVISKLADQRIFIREASGYSSQPSSNYPNAEDHWSSSLKSIFRGIVGEIETAMNENTMQNRRERFRQYRHSQRNFGYRVDPDVYSEDIEAIKKAEDSARKRKAYLKAKDQEKPISRKVASYLVVNGIIWYFYISALPGTFFFPPIVSIAWGIPLVLSIISWKTSSKKTKKLRLEQEDEESLGAYHVTYLEALEIKAAIDSMNKNSSSPIDDGLDKNLEDYLIHIKALAKAAHEIDGLVESIPVAGLAKDKETLLAKQARAENPALKQEYLNSIAEIVKQEKSYQELLEERELVRLKLKSAINQGKQLRLDLARLMASPAGTKATSIEAIKQRGAELSNYLADIRAGLGELKPSDPYAELAALEAEAQKKQISSKQG